MASYTSRKVLYSTLRSNDHSLNLVYSVFQCEYNFYMFL